MRNLRRTGNCWPPDYALPKTGNGKIQVRVEIPEIPDPEILKYRVGVQVPEILSSIKTWSVLSTRKVKFVNKHKQTVRSKRTLRNKTIKMTFSKQSTGHMVVVNGPQLRLSYCSFKQKKEEEEEENADQSHRWITKQMGIDNLTVFRVTKSFKETQTIRFWTWARRWIFPSVCSNRPNPTPEVFGASEMNRNGRRDVN